MEESKSENEENNYSDDSSDYEESEELKKEIDYEQQIIKGERILVFVRIRPFLEIDKKYDDDYSSPIKDIDLKNNSMTCKKN